MACPRRHSLLNELGPNSRIPSGPAVLYRLHDRPNRELHPTYVRSSNYPCNAGAIHRERRLTTAQRPKADKVDGSRSRHLGANV